MKISEAFPSEYLRAADLQGRQIPVVMERIEMRDLGDDTKPVLFFQGKSKGVVLNKTNANNIALKYGDDTNGWSGQTVILYETMVDYQGRSVAAIRIRPPKPSEVPVVPAQKLVQPEALPPRGHPVDDEIPF